MRRDQNSGRKVRNPNDFEGLKGGKLNWSGQQLLKLKTLCACVPVNVSGRIVRGECGLDNVCLQPIQVLKKADELLIFGHEFVRYACKLPHMAPNFGICDKQGLCVCIITVVPRYWQALSAVKLS